MIAVERTITKFLGLVRLSRIKSKIIVFSLLATFIPSLFMGWLSYRNNRQVLEESINQELVNLTSRASQGLDYWFSELILYAKFLGYRSLLYYSCCFCLITYDP